MNDRPPPEDAERQLHTLCPATPPDALMARLRAARPSTPTTNAAHPQHHARAWRTRWQPLLAIAAAVAVMSAVAVRQFGPRPAIADTHDVASTDHDRSPAPTRAGVTPVAASPAPPVFLPVESTRHLVSLQSVPTIQRPDEAPHRLLRAVFIDDMTAVGAETDAALHLRRAHEVYLPLSSPVY